MGATSSALSLGPNLTPGGIDTMHLSAERTVKMATRRADWFKLQAAKAISIIQRLTPFMEERLAVILASTVDIERSVKKLMSSTQSLSLYVLTGVHIEQLRKGESLSSVIVISIST